MVPDHTAPEIAITWTTWTPQIDQNRWVISVGTPRVFDIPSQTLKIDHVSLRRTRLWGMRVDFRSKMLVEWELDCWAVFEPFDVPMVKVGQHSKPSEAIHPWDGRCLKVLVWGHIGPTDLFMVNKSWGFQSKRLKLQAIHLKVACFPLRYLRSWLIRPLSLKVHWWTPSFASLPVRHEPQAIHSAGNRRSRWFYGDANDLYCNVVKTIVNYPFRNGL